MHSAMPPASSSCRHDPNGRDEEFANDNEWDADDEAEEHRAAQGAVWFTSSELANVGRVLGRALYEHSELEFCDSAERPENVNVEMPAECDSGAGSDACPSDDNVDTEFRQGVLERVKRKRCGNARRTKRVDSEMAPVFLQLPSGASSTKSRHNAKGDASLQKSVSPLEDSGIVGDQFATAGSERVNPSKTEESGEELELVLPLRPDLARIAPRGKAGHPLFFGDDAISNLAYSPLRTQPHGLSQSLSSPTLKGNGGGDLQRSSSMGRCDQVGVAAIGATSGTGGTPWQAHSSLRSSGNGLTAGGVLLLQTSGPFSFCRKLVINR